MIKYENIIVFGVANSLFITATGTWISHTAIKLLYEASNEITSRPLSCIISLPHAVNTISYSASLCIHSSKPVKEHCIVLA